MKTSLRVYLLSLVLFTGWAEAAEPSSATVISTPGAAVFRSVSANRDSIAPFVTADGRRIFFLSTASDLVPQDTNGAVLDLFVSDRTNATTTLVSSSLRGGAGGNGDTTEFACTADGRFVAFTSAASDLVSGDANEANDVFARDPGSAQLGVVSAAWNLSAPASAFGASWLGSRSYSTDGRWLVFTSQADNIVPDDGNHCADVFVRDRVAGTNDLVSVGVAGLGSGDASSVAPILSGNGRYVAFVSFSTNLTNREDTNRVEDVFVRDLETGVTTRVTSDPGLFPSTTPCRDPVLSPDGRFLCYTASPIGTDHLVLVDLQHSGSSEILAARYPDSINSFGVVISGDSHVLVTPAVPTNGGPGIGLLWRNLITGDSRTVQLATAEISDQVPDHLAISNDGRWVSFNSRGQSGTSSMDPSANIYLWDTATDNFRLVSVAADGLSAGNGASDGPTISADGRFVAYHTYAGNIVADDADELGDVIVYDRLTGQNQLVSDQVAVDALAEGPSFLPTIDPAGTSVVFGSGGVDLHQIPDAGFPLLVQKPFSRWTPVDSDADRLEDSWEQTWFDNLTQSDTDDPDLDTIANYAEYVAGTDPTDPASQFRVGIAEAADLTITLSWPAIAGRGYLVEHQDDLPGAAWQTAPVLISIRAAQARATGLPAPPGQRRFYRVVIGMD
jgi:Tol biopolymer transport system component